MGGRGMRRAIAPAVIAGLVLTVLPASAGAAVVPRADEPTCAQGGACAIGDIGPGGGVVFYDAGSRQEWGRYLEAAPKGWDRGRNPDPREPGCDLAGPKTRIGTGSTNSRNSPCARKLSSIGVAVGARAGGQTDWFLPSKGELVEMYAKRAIIPGMQADPYWSSSKSGNGSWIVDFRDGQRVPNASRLNEARVRPIRAFG